MASKSDPHHGKAAPRRPARKNASRTTDAPAVASASAAKESGGAKSLLRAGLKALHDVRDDVMTRQGRVFEALLGMDSAGGAKESKLIQASKELSGMQKFEEVFDQRVARALERLGMPSPQALAALCQQLEAINAHLQRIESPPAKKRTPRRRAPRP